MHLGVLSFPLFTQNFYVRELFYLTEKKLQVFLKNHFFEFLHQRLEYQLIASMLNRWILRRKYTMQMVFVADILILNWFLTLDGVVAFFSKAFVISTAFPTCCPITSCCNVNMCVCTYFDIKIVCFGHACGIQRHQQLLYIF